MTGALLGLVSLPLALTASGQTIFSEDFEGVVLGPNQDETAFPAAAVWAKSPPAEWSINDTGVAGINEAGRGVTEWKGWSFANKDWWAQVAENQGRSDFARAAGTVAIADPDEWDDIGNPASLGTFNSFLRSPTINIAGLRPNSLELSFDSSFRPEGNQRATVVVSYEGAETTVLDWVATEDNKTNERITIPLNNPPGATSMIITWGLTNAVNNWWWAIDNIKVDRVGPLFEENFDSLPLQDSIDEPNFGTEVWTNEPPSGWSIDNSEMFKGYWDPEPPPEDFTLWPGRSEWKGWAFATIEWWPTVDDQRRSEFLKASGTVAIADPDEWDDSGSPVAQGGMFNSFLKTPEISLAGIPANTVLLKFDSAWRPECCDEDPLNRSNNQTASIDVSFDGGAPVRILEWSSNTSDENYKDDNSTNDTILVPVPNPAGARTMTLNFGLSNAGNDWFWAIDNITVTAGVATLTSVSAGPTRVVFEIADTGANKIDTTTIALKLDDVAVPATVTTEGNIIRVTHTPASPFPPASTHTYVLTASDTAAATLTFDGSFTTPTPFLPLEPLPGPSGSEGQFGVRYLWSTGSQISGIARALETIIAAPTPDYFGMIFDTTHPFINHGDSRGFIPGDEPYPDDVQFGDGWTDEDFVMLAKGRILITEPGEYTFGVHTDDGFGLRLFGAEFTAINGAGLIDPGNPNSFGHPGDTGDSDTRAVATLQPGEYDIEFFWWERSGGDFGELYATKGRFLNDSDTDTWRLIGDDGGLPLVGPPSSSDFRITNVVKGTDPASITLTFTVNPDVSYNAQYSLNLLAWTDIGEPVTPAAGATTATTTIPLTNPPLSTATQAHFRIRERP